MASTSLTFERQIDVPPAEAYRAFTHTTALRDWFCTRAQVDARQGGRFYFGWDSGFYATGVFTALDLGRKIALAWNGKDEPTPMRVQVSLKPKGDGTLVTIAHAGVGSGKKWAATIHAIEEGWNEGLENLQSVLETGIDLRVARLPRMGIFIDDFNAEIAARLSVPVKAGIRLAGVADGTGAQAAGFQKDDVIVKLGGKKAVDFPTLSRALEGHHAGDRVPVVFYRGGEKQTVTLELSKRPMQEAPPLSDLVEAVRRNFADLNAELEKLIEGLSEDEAAHRSAPEAWSIKDTVAHFILCERDFQSWVAQMINDRETGDDLEFRPNVTPRIRAMIEVRPTLAALLDELKRAQTETTAMLAALPEELIGRKHVYRRAAFWMIDVVPSHYRDEHFGLMRAAIESARQITN